MGLLSSVLFFLRLPLLMLRIYRMDVATFYETVMLRPWKKLLGDSATLVHWMNVGHFHVVDIDRGTVGHSLLTAARLSPDRCIQVGYWDEKPKYTPEGELRAWSYVSVGERPR